MRSCKRFDLVLWCNCRPARLVILSVLQGFEGGLCFFVFVSFHFVCIFETSFLPDSLLCFRSWWRKNLINACIAWMVGAKTDRKRPKGRCEVKEDKEERSKDATRGSWPYY